MTRKAFCNCLSCWLAENVAPRRFIAGMAGLLHQHSKFASASSVKSTLYSRLYNLIDRGMVTREGMSYCITDTGRAWLGKALPARKSDPRKELLEAVKRYNEQQKSCCANKSAQ